MQTLSPTILLLHSGWIPETDELVIWFALYTTCFLLSSLILTCIKLDDLCNFVLSALSFTNVIIASFLPEHRSPA